MLKYPPETRFTSQQACSHDWIKRSNLSEVKASTAKSLLANLRVFHVRWEEKANG